MKQFLIVMFLFVIIFSTFLYIFFYIALNFSKPANGVNRLFRKPIIRSKLLKTAFRLKQLGDARFDYATNEQYDNLHIIPFISEGFAYSGNSLSEAVSEMVRVVSPAKNIVLERTRTLSDIPEGIDDRMLNKILSDHPANFSPANRTAVVQIFLLGHYIPKPTYLGYSKNAYAVFLFSDAMDDASSTKQSRTDIETSTILHEFAHILGAEHIANKGCILDEKFESDSQFTSPVTTQYCKWDIEAIEEAL